MGWGVEENVETFPIREEVMGVSLGHEKITRLNGGPNRG